MMNSSRQFESQLPWLREDGFGCHVVPLTMLEDSNMAWGLLLITTLSTRLLLP
jgi:hypothetical protein